MKIFEKCVPLVLALSMLLTISASVYNAQLDLRDSVDGVGAVTYPVSWQDDILSAPTPDETEQQKMYVERGIEILGSFPSFARGSSADAVQIDSASALVESIDLSDALGSTQTYLDVRHQLNLTLGDTIPVYFLNEDATTIVAVKQDAYGLNYRYTFALDDDGKWLLQGEPDTVQCDFIYAEEFTKELLAGAF